MLFGFAALQAVILNKALSLVVVATALPARLAAVPLSVLVPHWGVVVNLLVGSLAGAWVGASWATPDPPLDSSVAPSRAEPTSGSTSSNPASQMTSG